MKKIFAFLIILSAMACSEKGNKSGNAMSHDDENPSHSKALLITQIQKCSKLYTAEIKVHKIVTHNDEIKLKGSILQQDFDIPLPLGSRKMAIPMDATIKAYIDFSDFSDKNVKITGKNIEIILPDPQVELTSTRINHEDVKRHVPLLRSNFSDNEMAEYAAQGRKAIINDIPKMGIIRMAQESATRTLVPILRQIGYEESDITVTFRKNLNYEDITDIIIKTDLERK
ncbi:DUF4230 domain-containing protein [Prevotella sp. OH937_COT-195]|uniref:DUF4230 domain-containing protein n=1 Tax=Prevotella sp. OH937_COT-195 TaxID=2491051 RepID=UPI000F648C78|nr:DUF4230 domain-containing protein [Prevotella sp. OH937_COT-195]RRD02204.1 DUF4230 domain-containing protein [Prevotella sp. OH937_COT-195]